MPRHCVIFQCQVHDDAATNFSSGAAGARSIGLFRQLTMQSPCEGRQIATVKGHATRSSIQATRPKVPDQRFTELSLIESKHGTTDGHLYGRFFFFLLDTLMGMVSISQRGASDRGRFPAHCQAGTDCISRPRE